MSRSGPQYALLAGSGFHAFAEDAVSHEVSTRYGDPSSAVRELSYGDHTVYLIARHGDEIGIPAHRVNYRANMQALKSFGTERVVALNTVGIVSARQYPGQLAVPDQLIDYTHGRDHSIHDGESDSLEHVDFTEPFCPDLRRAILQAADDADVECHDGGVYAVTQGPRLETTAEVNRLERDGADYVGMTAMPEASLARELGMRYACFSLIVNYAAGRGEKAIHEDIEASTMTAKMQAMKVLREFFQQQS